MTWSTTKRYQLLLVLLALAVLAGCTNKYNPNVYSGDQAMQADKISYGTITRMHAVTIKDENTGVGLVGGGIAGGVLGSQIGGGSGQVVGAVGGALLGAAAGALAEDEFQKTDGVQITVRLDSGGSVSIVQAAEGSNFSVGQRVRVITSPNGRARVLPY
ncbi:glycine zipper 2TM domain-containing protein [Halodesulfovibrio marinisediminis]|uniref:Outer membrane lipoprotein SlyB n=1 Tax=Halodesulfovibrio marinisediminis DSM 17456 TaxID=1121457 RepID=A0A1N6HB52_9BACT|nr:glycine zipper 2TM domain-containing protein [Halodesulfovibrio marinisediminis]SIO16986.1 outer membrane lipoprotein SlyB [Halodesulfovibrio marinisediminis DSM 17456]